MTHVQDSFLKSLSTATFERKLSSVSFPLVAAYCAYKRENLLVTFSLTIQHGLLAENLEYLTVLKANLAWT